MTDELTEESRREYLESLEFRVKVLEANIIQLRDRVVELEEKLNNPAPANYGLGNGNYGIC